MDYYSCTLTFINKKLKWIDIEIKGVICDGFFYILPIDIPDSPINHHRANLINYSQLIEIKH